MPELTETARKNLARGATSGAGTDRCDKCEGPKEERRLNSGRCANCDRKPGDRSIPSTTTRTPDREVYAVLVWIVKSRLVVPDDITLRKTPLTEWARENGYQS